MWVERYVAQKACSAGDAIRVHAVVLCKVQQYSGLCGSGICEVTSGSGEATEAEVCCVKKHVNPVVLR